MKKMAKKMAKKLKLNQSNLKKEGEDQNPEILEIVKLIHQQEEDLQDYHHLDQLLQHQKEKEKKEKINQKREKNLKKENKRIILRFIKIIFNFIYLIFFYWSIFILNY